jgi:hypothetical protein
MNDKKMLGLYGKFDVKRTDGKDEPGQKHHGCQYFVLDLTHDPFALPAIRAYADACRDEFPVLAIDLFALAATSAPAPESVAANELEDVETGASEAQTAKTGKEEIDG